jgi:hypothetical protein
MVTTQPFNVALALLPKIIHLVECQHWMATIITLMWSGHQW